MQDPDRQPPLRGELPGGGLGYALNEAANAWRAELAAALAPAAVTPAQFFVLASLLHRHRRGRPAPSQREVAERTGMDANTASQVVRGLQARGIVRRERHPGDSRAVALSLTDLGLELARTCAREARTVNRRYFGDADAQELLVTLTTLAAASRERRRDA